MGVWVCCEVCEGVKSGVHRWFGEGAMYPLYAHTRDLCVVDLLYSSSSTQSSLEEASPTQMSVVSKVCDMCPLDHTQVQCDMCGTQPIWLRCADCFRQWLPTTQAAVDSSPLAGHAIPHFLPTAIAPTQLSRLAGSKG